MTELSSQVNNLRLMARLVRDYDYKEISRMLREAADTIEDLRSSLNEVADKWAEAQIKAEDHARENMLLKCDNDTRWRELFGTPERAAGTLERAELEVYDYCAMVNSKCDECRYEGCDGYGCYNPAPLLEWLRGDAE